MGYVADSLLPDEELLLAARPHWGAFVPAILVTGVGSGLVLWIGSLWAAPVLVLGLGWVLKVWIARMSSQSLVTSRRVIVRSGLWRSQTIELEHRNIESFVIEQTPLGRVFNYGTVIVNGVGGARLPVTGLARPGQFRRAALQAEERLKLGPGFFHDSSMLGGDLPAMGREIVLQVKLTPEQLAQTRGLPPGGDTGRGVLLEHEPQQPSDPK